MGSCPLRQGSPATASFPCTSASWPNINVDSDELTAAGFRGTLKEFAAERLNAAIAEMADADPATKIKRVVSIHEKTWTHNVRPLECNPNTWYTRAYCALSVWAET